MVHTPERVTQILPHPHSPTKPMPADNRARSALFLEGKQIGRYELIYHIASGGMASVYAGRLVGMAGFERLVAIKIIHPHLTSEPAFVQMFLDEARLAAHIDHPNVVKIHEVGEDDGIYYMVGELVQGKDLRQLIEKTIQLEMTLPTDIVIDIISRICAGLGEAHHLTDANGEHLSLIHRDVSTRNIIISYNGHPKLIDFGAAWAKGRLTHTTNGLIKGKVGYMPPEQLRGESIDVRADVYALGVVLYTAATGSHPFPYDNEAQQIAKALAGDFPLPGHINPQLSFSLEKVILRAMSTEPRLRFQSMDAFQAALEDCRKEMASSDKTSLSRLMKSLFKEEIGQEKERINSHRSQQSSNNILLFPGEYNTEPIDASKRSSSRRNLPIFLAICTAVLVAGVLWWNGFHVFKSPDAKLQKGHAASSMVTSSSDNTPVDGLTMNVEANPSAKSDTVTISFNGTTPDTTFFVDGKSQALPIRLPRSTVPKIIELQSPSHEKKTVSVIPAKDISIFVEQPPLKNTKKKSSPANRKHSMQKSERNHKPTRTPQRNNSQLTKSSLQPSLSFETNPFNKSIETKKSSESL
ncbi:MAG: serine/threonine protein kinase [Deltaproteobacteria bacterium]|nr:serine/threonine protein kinase [Deltaproteobacteria bacterium]